MDNRILKQSKCDFEAEISLFKEFFEYHVKSKGVEFKKILSYEKVSNNFSKYKDENQWLIASGTIFIVAAFVIGFANNFEFSTGGAITLVMGVMSFIKFQSSRLKHLLIESEEASIVLLDNEESDALFEEIKKRRNEKLKDRLININWENPMEMELNKFIWLHGLGVIDEFEMERIRKEITSK